MTRTTHMSRRSSSGLPNRSLGRHSPWTLIFAIALSVVASWCHAAPIAVQHRNEAVWVNPDWLSPNVARIETNFDIKTQPAGSPHPYPAPDHGDPSFHASPQPMPFTFSMSVFETNPWTALTAAYVLPGVPRSGIGDPWATSYDLKFFQDDSGRFVIDEGHEWNMRLDYTQGKVVKAANASFRGFEVGVEWDTNTKPFLFDFVQIGGSPAVNFTYNEAIKDWDGWSIKVTGFVTTDGLGFGRIGADGTAAVVLDAWPNPAMPDWFGPKSLEAPVYDVVNSVPEIDPAGLGSVATLIAGWLGLIERRRPRMAHSPVRNHPSPDRKPRNVCSFSDR